MDIVSKTRENKSVSWDPVVIGGEDEVKRKRIGDQKGGTHRTGGHLVQSQTSQMSLFQSDAKVLVCLIKILICNVIRALALSTMCYIRGLWIAIKIIKVLVPEVL